ncbi:FkbM family methyltransferase [Dyadobacter aurulentus]|uniref:FkbM family methyltransferase n=1 Tax=Dyadobacter sp. UC 10 TaxID=2605428 RepID=UPI0011F19F4F|nr:FkbM family methyltransferase [Dyadobacter sp. UC 10]KAA0989993.1 FkbM family methyltransferase [Dyadobacter sp. UC 10]
MLEYLEKWLTRRRARRQFSEYAHVIDTFQLVEEGMISFANWKNPLIKPKTISQGEVNFFKQFIKKGSLCIDIGTNIGDTTVPMALAAGNAGTTLGFDPNPYVFKILEINASLNKDKTNIVPLPYAITKVEGEFSYASSEASFGNGGIANEIVEDHGAFQLSSKIKGIRLEDFLRKNYASMLPKLSFIKVDVEGADKEVIVSISNLIREFRPVLIAECFPKSTVQERAELFRIVSELGYDLYYFSDFCENAEVVKVVEAKDMNKWKMFNFYALPNGK